NSLGCDVAMGAGLILAAPILGPAALLSDAAGDAKAKRMAREWHAGMQTRLSEGDAQAVQECLVNCLYSWRYEIDYDDRWVLAQKAARLYMAGGSTAENTQEHRVYSALAHYVLSWQPESPEKGAPLKVVYEQARQTYELLKDESTRTRLRTLLKSSYYSELMRGTYGLMYAGSMPNDEGAAHDRYRQCPKEIQSLFLEERSAIYRISACSSAY